MFYSVALAITVDVIIFELVVRQLAARIPFEDVAQRDAWKISTLMKFAASTQEFVQIR
jgi:hypothetical protein